MLNIGPICWKARPPAPEAEPADRNLPSPLARRWAILHDRDMILVSIFQRGAGPTRGGETMAANEAFPLVFEQLKRILQKYEPHLLVTQNTPDSYSLNTPYSEKWQKELLFGAVQVKKNYVSFYLMPVYMYPDLLTGLSDGLQRRMQGKSCFNFKAVDKDLFKELAQLAHRSAARVKQDRLF
jgi:hypothetical protein